MKEIEQKRIFDKWLSERRAIIFNVVRAHSRNHHDSEDLFQEIAVQEEFNLVWYLSTLLPLPLLYVCVHYGLKKSDLPKLRELEVLQAKFNEN